MIQSLLPAIYPLLKNSFHLDFGQIGLITATNQVIASMLQPVIGLYTDKRPQPYSLPVGMAFTLSALLLLSVASTFPIILFAAAMAAAESAVSHPELFRLAPVGSWGQGCVGAECFVLWRRVRSAKAA